MSSSPEIYEHVYSVYTQVVVVLNMPRGVDMKTLNSVVGIICTMLPVLNFNGVYCWYYGMLSVRQLISIFKLHSKRQITIYKEKHYSLMKC